jgi:hypothetical protein
LIRDRDQGMLRGGLGTRHGIVGSACPSLFIDAAGSSGFPRPPHFDSPRLIRVSPTR